MTAQPPRARLLSALLTTLRGRVGMGEGSLKAWGSQQKPPVGLTTVESLAAQLVKDGLATHEVKAIDGSSFYRPVPVGSAASAPTPTPTPAPEVRVSKKTVVALPIEDFLAYCAGVAAGPREASVYSWLRVRGIPRAAAEGLLSQLLQERRLERRERSVAGETIVRYAVADPSVEPAPLPRSDAPAEPPANDDVDPGDPEDDEGAEDDPRAAFDEDPEEEEACRICVELTRERDRAEGELSVALVGGEGLRDHLTVARRERDDALAEARIYHDAICEVAPGLRGASPRHLAGVLGEIVRELREEREGLQERLWAAENALQGAQARPTVDGGTLASYLTRLTDDQWLVVQRGRAQLAEARDLRAKAAELEEEGTRTLEALLSEKPSQAPASPPPPPPVEAPPVAAPSGETVREEEEAPPSEEGPRLPPAGTLQYDVLQLVLKRGKSDAETLAGKLRETKQRVSSALSLLAKRGILVRVATGLYEVAPTARRAA